MKIKLNFFERISIPTIFPEKATFADAIIYDDIRQKIKITQQEVTTYNIRSTADGSGIEWDSEPEGGIEYDFTDAEVKLVSKCLIDLDKKAQIPVDSKFISLFKKFVKNE